MVQGPVDHIDDNSSSWKSVYMKPNVIPDPKIQGNVSPNGLIGR